MELKELIAEAFKRPETREAIRAYTEIRTRTYDSLLSSQEFERLRAQARAIKEATIAQLDRHIEAFQRAIERHGGRVFLAKTGEEAVRYIVNVAKRRRVRRVVKSKSMTTEEIRLNAALEEVGLEVVETDLGERLVQLAKDHPSHFIGPSIHLSKEEISRLFAQWLNLDPPPDPNRRPEELLRLARQALREIFLQAEMGITGANFAIAQTGSLVLVENEGNIRFTTQLPPIHIAVLGIEKLLPTLEDLLVFLKLLPRCGTGQAITSYVSILTGPSPLPSSGTDRRELHVILLDNGRSRLRADPELREALYCIRCGACLNICPPFQEVGGHVYGEPGGPYVGGIGNAWAFGLRGSKVAARFNELCTTCGRCTEICPVKIDIPWLNEVIRSRLLNKQGWKARLTRRVLGSLDLLLMWGSRTASLSNALLRSSVGRRLAATLLDFDPRRPWPLLHRETLQRWARHRHRPLPTSLASTRQVLLFADCFTNFYEPKVGQAAVNLLERLGYSVNVIRPGCCGRIALSQGQLSKARRRLQRVLQAISAHEQDPAPPVVFVEPSCLATLRHEVHRLLPQESSLASIAERAWDILEFLDHLRRAGELTWPFSFEDFEKTSTLVFHGHCQQKAIKAFPAAASLLSSIPNVQLDLTRVPCCGMAGTFGYKRAFFPISQSLAERLCRQLPPKGIVLASGFSCRAQIRELCGQAVLHPIEWLNRMWESSETA